jgi:hypothetical protein
MEVRGQMWRRSVRGRWGLLVDRRAHYSPSDILYGIVREKGHIYPVQSYSYAKSMTDTTWCWGGGDGDEGWDEPRPIYDSDWQWATPEAGGKVSVWGKRDSGRHSIRNRRHQFVEGAQVRLLPLPFHATLSCHPKVKEGVTVTT